MVLLLLAFLLSKISLVIFRLLLVFSALSDVSQVVFPVGLSTIEILGKVLADLTIISFFEKLVEIVCEVNHNLLLLSSISSRLFNVFFAVGRDYEGILPVFSHFECV